MKTKMIIVLLFLPMSIMNGSISPIHRQKYQFIQASVQDIPPDTMPIELQGLLDYGAGPNDIVAAVIGDYIQVNFYRNFGNVCIELFHGSTALIYHDIINTDVQTMIQIPINSSAGGSYTLVLSNGNGIVEGGFD